MNQKHLFESLTKSIGIAISVTTLLFGVTVIVSFFWAFAQRASFTMPFNLAVIESTQNNEGFFTSFHAGSGLLPTAIISVVTLSILLFCYLYFVKRPKK